jgi:hypothetical protein
MIKWIPRAARQHCATLLTKLIMGVVGKPGDVGEWVKLLAFGRSILLRPVRGGARRNLTNILTRRCATFLSDPLQGAAPPVAASRPRRPKKGGTGGGGGEGTLTDLARAVTVRLEEGNFKGAVRRLASDEALAPPTPETLRKLQEKHPLAPSDRRPFPPVDPSQSQIFFEEAAVRRAILSFPPGSSGGPDGLTPQHIRDLITFEGQSSPLLVAITALVNSIAAGGGMPDSVKPYFFGGRLIALSKKDGGIRPIVVGQTLRRLTSKLISSYATEKVAGSLMPLQLGIGVSGGVEAAVHAARRYVEQLAPGGAVVKLDFCNAFNAIRRDAVLESVAATLPEVYSYINASYSSPSHLAFGDEIIESAEGVQQGDPLGPLLFCLAIHPLLTHCGSELRIGYLDDLTFGGELPALAVEIGRLRIGAAALGLTLNDGKCEVISSAPNPVLPSSVSQFAMVNTSDATILGAPLLQEGAMDKALDLQVARLKLASTRLSCLQSHDALTILRYSLSLPKLLYSLRSSFCGNHPALREFDVVLRHCLCQILNVSLDEDQWTQATLPVKSGGLGIRRAHQIAPSAYLASASGVAQLVSSILPPRLQGLIDPHEGPALAAWIALGGTTPPTGPTASSQRAWDLEIITSVSGQLLASAPDDYSRARLLAVSSPHSGDWLNAPPITAMGLRMSNEAIRVATGLRLGANLCMPHICRCGAQVDARGSHGLSCVRSAGRHQRHAMINDIIHRGLGRADIAAVKEPTGLLTGSSLRPDGATLIPWARGKCLTWDATTPDTLANSHLPSTRSQAGAAAAHSSSLKDVKYSAFTPTHLFVPVAVETLGPWNMEGLAFIRELGRRTALITGDPRETSFLLQRVSMAVQLGNAASIVGSLPARTGDD